MTIDQTPAEPVQTTPPASADRPHSGRFGAAAAVLSVGLVGGLAMGVVESTFHKRSLLDHGAVWLWIESLSFSVVTHVAFCLGVCAAACLVGGLTIRAVKRLDGRRAPGALAFAGLFVGEALMTAWGIALMAGSDLPVGLAGLAWAALAWLGALALVVPVCRWLSRRLLGRLLATATRVAVWPAGVAAVIAVAVLVSDRRQPQPADGFWPVSAAQGTTRPIDRPPNIVLVVCDALRADRLGCYGYTRPTSPHIDAFAADAAVFERAVSPAPWTIPAHASIFTGLYPSQHGARFGLTRLWLDDDFVTLAEALRERGYETIGLSSNPIVSPVTNLTQGIDRFVSPIEYGYSWGATHLAFFRQVFGKMGVLGPIVARWFAADPGGHATTALAETYLRGRDPSRPLFLFVNLMETHDPYEPMDAYRRCFVQPDEVVRSYQLDQNGRTTWQYALAGKPVYSPSDIGILSDLYDARVRELDDHFADLMRILADVVDLDHTVIVLTSDHGENLGERGLLGHQFCIYNTLLHVPLIVRYPGAIRRQRTGRLVQTCDLFPTLLGWAGAGATQTGKVMARPLMPDAPATSTSAGRSAYAEYLFWPASPLEMLQRMDPSFDGSRWRVAYRAVFHDRWKLILGSGRRFELYDLTADPSESRNVVASDRSTMARLAQQVGRWVGSFEHYDAARAGAPGDPRIDEEQRKRLRSLGYVD